MNKSRILQALRSSNESLTDDQAQAAAQGAAIGAPEGTDAVVEEVVAAPDEVEQPLLDQAEAEQEVIDSDAAVEEATEVAEALESLQTLLAAQSEDGLNTQGATFAHFAAESLYKRVGLMEGHGLPSLESFNTHSSRVRATELSVESVGQKLKEFWAAIVQMLAKAKDAVINFLKKIVDANHRVTERANKLAAAAQKTSGNAKEGEIELGSLANKLASGGNVDLAGGLKTIEAVLADTQKFSEAESAQLMAHYKSLSETVASGKAPEGAQIAAGVTNMPATAAFKNAVEGREGVKATDDLPGGVKFYVGMEESALGNLKLNFAVSGKIKGEAKASSTKIKTLSPSECQTLIKEVQNVLAAAKKASEWADGEAARSKKTFVGLKVGDEAGIKDQVILRSQMRAFQKAEAEQGKATSRVAAYAVEFSNNVLTAVQKSLAQYGNTTAVAKAE